MCLLSNDVSAQVGEKKIYIIKLTENRGRRLKTFSWRRGSLVSSVGAEKCMNNESALNSGWTLCTSTELRDQHHMTSNAHTHTSVHSVTSAEQQTCKATCSGVLCLLWIITLYCTWLQLDREREDFSFDKPDDCWEAKEDAASQSGKINTDQPVLERLKLPPLWQLKCVCVRVFVCERFNV